MCWRKGSQSISWIFYSHHNLNNDQITEHTVQCISTGSSITQWVNCDVWLTSQRLDARNIMIIFMRLLSGCKIIYLSMLHLIPINPNLSQLIAWPYLSGVDKRLSTNWSTVWFRGIVKKIAIIFFIVTTSIYLWSGKEDHLVSNLKFFVWRNSWIVKTFCSLI